MTDREFWFRKIPGTSGRYVPTDWRGYAAIVASVVAPLGVTFLSMAIQPWLALVCGPLALIGALWWLFAVVAKRAES